jgi:ATP-dependent helicase/nuclease subunit A
MMTVDTLDAIAVAQRAQSQAIDPKISAWVSASAGSGKTTVLTNRVLALMLAGVAPQRILCVTFTKAAAAEMANRITQSLAKWVSAPDAALTTDISALLLRDATTEDGRRARQLFARVLDAPGGLRIQTIHAFCQSLLRRFPIEAGISPQFELMDERSAADVLDQARDAIIVSADAGHNPRLAEALAFMTSRLHETRFPEIVSALIFQRAKIERLFERHGGLTETGLRDTIVALKSTLNLHADDTSSQAITEACAETSIDAPALKRAIAALVKGTKTDQERAVVMAQWLDAPAQRMSRFDDYSSVFLTQEKELRKTLLTKDANKFDPEALPIMQREAARLITLHARLARLKTAEATSALLSVALEILASYRDYKRQRSLLDYDDLIQTTRRLLRTPGVAAWVLYKLDGGIDHILIDEAQDTNPEQWDIIGALTDEFFAGEGRFEDRAQETTIARTVFAVGDRKQSIYSFQGADPAGFSAWRDVFAAKVGDAERLWRNVDMNVSFRSTESVLKAVDLAFTNLEAKDGVATGNETIGHLVARKGMAGRVELWPPVIPLQSDEPPPWKPPVERTRGDSPQNRLAQLIAERIARMVGSENLPARDKVIGAGDIMVLVRRRTSFVDELVRQLKVRQVPVAGVDRMVLPQQLAVMDLIALGQFLLLPSDDLTLATILKSPLIGLFGKRCRIMQVPATSLGTHIKPWLIFWIEQITSRPMRCSRTLLWPVTGGARLWVVWALMPTTRLMNSWRSH